MRLFVGAKGIVYYRSKVLLIQESSGYVDGGQVGKWDVAGGRIEPDENLRDGLVREVKEECGITVVPGKLMGAFDGYPVIRGEKCHVVRLYFLCEAGTDQITLSKDHDRYEWVDPGKLEDKELVDDIAEMLEEFKNVAI